jgi:mannose-1-phosphate guanylyltransferase
MKAFLLAGGKGTRLSPLTDSLPKCLAPVRGVPLLQIWLENCRAAGIDHVLINLHAHAEKVRHFLATQNTGVQVVLAEEEDLLGSAGTLRENRSFVAGEPDFFVLFADVLTSLNLKKMLQFHHSKGMAATLGIYQAPDPTGCGIVNVNQEEIIHGFVEKPSSPQSNWAFSGLVVATQKIFDVIPQPGLSQGLPVDLGFHVLPKLVGRMAAYRVRDYLLDIGTWHNYATAQSSWPGNPTWCGPTNLETASEK